MTDIGRSLTDSLAHSSDTSDGVVWYYGILIILKKKGDKVHYYKEETVNTLLITKLIDLSKNM